MLKTRFIKKGLYIALETPVSVSWTRRHASIDGNVLRIYNVNIFFENTFLIADAVMRKNLAGESSIILFKKNVAEEFIFDGIQYIRHVVSVKDEKGILYKGSFGSFSPKLETLQQLQKH